MFCSYVVGGEFLNFFTEFYKVKDPELYENFSPTSSEWVGAWWLGFNLIVALGLASAASMMVFPAKIQTKEVQNTTKETCESEDDLDILHVDRCAVYVNVKDMPKAIFALLKNTTYMAICLGICMDAFLIAGKNSINYSCYPESKKSFRKRHSLFSTLTVKISTIHCLFSDTDIPMALSVVILGPDLNESVKRTYRVTSSL